MEVDVSKSRLEFERESRKDEVEERKRKIDQDEKRFDREERWRDEERAEKKRESKINFFLRMIDKGKSAEEAEAFWNVIQKDD